MYSLLNPIPSKTFSFDELTTLTSLTPTPQRVVAPFPFSRSICALRGG